VTALRVAYVLGTTSGGTGRHAAMLAEGCGRAGLGISVFGPAETRWLFSPGTANSHVVLAFEPVQIADRPRPAGDAVAVARLSGLLSRAAPDVVHAHGLRAGAAAALALAGDRAHAPALIVTVHNAPPAAALPAAVYGMLERVVARRAAAVLCVSRDLADRMRRLGARDAALAVVPAPAVAAPSAGAIMRARADIGSGGRPVVLAAGRLTGQKGFGTLLDAAARWQDRDPLPQLAIAGDGPLAAGLARNADAAGLAVCFLGQRGDVPALLAAADVLAVPSRWEGQPLIVQEALRAGRPIVACRVGGIPDLTGGDAALLVPAGEPAQLAAAVLRVLDDQDLAGRLGAAALARAAALPSAADAVQAVLAVYGRLAAQRLVPGKPWRQPQ
jgi:glycosyltransferase involved in cell wall biosynthesis